MTAASGPIRVYLADDHGLVRFGMKSLLESEPDIEVVGEAADGARATTEICEVQPDVVVLDLRMPESNGIEVCTAVKAQCPAVKILVLTSYDEDEEVFGAINAGADGYLLKENRPEQIIYAIRAVKDGQSVFDGSVAGRIIAGPQTPKSIGEGEPLSEREIEVLQLMANGMSNREIGQALWISETTVKTHVSHILRKLGQQDRTQAVLAAVKAGMIRLGR
jgi:DNA-binding NarL/FixJ family response regulator